MAKQSEMYMTGDRNIGLREYLQRGERRAKKVRALIRLKKTNAQIAEATGLSAERIRQIRKNGIDHQGEK
jgi:DNA-directed RNA polymerase sigma subunit (sigma70/sigma32)